MVAPAPLCYPTAPATAPVPHFPPSPAQRATRGLLGHVPCPHRTGPPPALGPPLPSLQESASRGGASQYRPPSASAVLVATDIGDHPRPRVERSPTTPGRGGVEVHGDGNLLGRRRAQPAGDATRGSVPPRHARDRRTEKPGVRAAKVQRRAEQAQPIPRGTIRRLPGPAPPKDAAPRPKGYRNTYRVQVDAAFIRMEAPKAAARRTGRPSKKVRAICPDFPRSRPGHRRRPPWRPSSGSCRHQKAIIFRLFLAGPLAWLTCSRAFKRSAAATASVGRQPPRHTCSRRGLSLTLEPVPRVPGLRRPCRPRRGARGPAFPRYCRPECKTTAQGGRTEGAATSPTPRALGPRPPHRRHATA